MAMIKMQVILHYLFMNLLEVATIDSVAYVAGCRLNIGSGKTAAPSQRF